MEIERKIIWIWLSFLGKPNYVVTDMLLQEYGTLENLWNSVIQNRISEGLKKQEKLFCKLTNRSLREKAAAIYEKCMEQKIRITTAEELHYPHNLYQVINKPPVLYYKGMLPYDIKFNENLLLSIVGSRKCTAYGRTNSYLFSKYLAQNGMGIVSGMARGIDSEAHKGALAGEGYTIAVLGGGPDVVYPQENKKLYDKICETGCVLSEYPPGAPPLRAHFPARNRIISGLSLGTLVVEAGKNSGAMITVDKAFEQSRTVYAVPGNITSEASVGCNDLIKSQGICVTSYSDILEDYGLRIPKPMQETCGWINGLTDAEAAAASAIKRGHYSINELVRDADRSTANIISALTMLEIKGIVTQAPDGTYKLIK